MSGVLGLAEARPISPATSLAFWSTPIMHGRQMRRRGGRHDRGERQSGQDQRYDGGKDGSPAMTPVSADPAMPSVMGAHDSSRATPQARSRPCAALPALMAL